MTGIRFLDRSHTWNWHAFIWLVYLIIPVVVVVIKQPPAWMYLAEAGVLVAFLFCYFACFDDWNRQRRWLPITGMVVVGLIGCIFVTEANWGMFVYAASFAGYHTDLRHATVGIVLVVVTVATTAALGFLTFWATVACIPMCMTVGFANFFTARLLDANQKLQNAREEIGRLAVVAERERIARDLHDLLGHTLSVIVLKSELARRLADRNPERAAQEIGEVEQISRDALNQVRLAVSGVRNGGISAEWERSRAALASADIHVNHALTVNTLYPAVDGTLAMVLREAVTNVLRHSHATECQVFVNQKDGFVTLSVSDNGNGLPTTASGNGIRGMRERVQLLGGTFEIGPNGERGTRVHARLAQPATT